MSYSRSGVFVLLAVGAQVATVGCERAPPVLVEPNPAEAAARGHRIFIQVCAQCHGLNGEGVDFMGARLIGSAWVAERSDVELVKFLKEGRPAQADRPAMPPKGGRLDLTDGQLRDVVAHMRVLQHQGIDSNDITDPPGTGDESLRSHP